MKTAGGDNAVKVASRCLYIFFLQTAEYRIAASQFRNHENKFMTHSQPRLMPCKTAPGRVAQELDDIHGVCLRVL